MRRSTLRSKERELVHKNTVSVTGFDVVLSVARRVAGFYAVFHSPEEEGVTWRARCDGRGPVTLVFVLIARLICCPLAGFCSSGDGISVPNALVVATCLGLSFFLTSSVCVYLMLGVGTYLRADHTGVWLLSRCLYDGSV